MLNKDQFEYGFLAAFDPEKPAFEETFFEVAGYQTRRGLFSLDSQGKRTRCFRYRQKEQ